MMRRLLLAFAAASLLAACARTAPETPMARNPIPYVEIPVADLDRAVIFYEAVFGFSLERQTVDGYAMALFPFTDGAPGATAALAKGEVYAPSKQGAILYFHVDDMDAVMKRAEQAGGAILYPRKDIGELGFVGEIQDSEGNRIGLSQPPAG
jgi:predicted enzyme related to lactoylglutathione lyase